MKSLFFLTGDCEIYSEDLVDTVMSKLMLKRFGGRESCGRLYSRLHLLYLLHPCRQLLPSARIRLNYVCLTITHNSNLLLIIDVIVQDRQPPTDRLNQPRQTKVRKGVVKIQETDRGVRR